MKIALGSDHAGFDYKEKIKEHLKSQNHEVIDTGTYSEERADYPDFGIKTARAVAAKEADFGVVVCSSGIGINIAANKVKGARAGIAYNDDVAALMRRHNNCNVITFAQRFMEIEDVLKRLDIFLNTPFDGGRHEKRVLKLEGE